MGDGGTHKLLATFNGIPLVRRSPTHWVSIARACSSSQGTDTRR
ncbi:hypothetical protein [Pararhizobium sp. PWRC1-1]